MLKDFAADLEKSPVLKVCLYEHLHYNIYIFNILLTYRQVETDRERQVIRRTSLQTGLLFLKVFWSHDLQQGVKEGHIGQLTDQDQRLKETREYNKYDISVSCYTCNHWTFRWDVWYCNIQNILHTDHYVYFIVDYSLNYRNHQIMLSINLTKISTYRCTISVQSTDWFMDLVLFDIVVVVLGVSYRMTLTFWKYPLFRDLSRTWRKYT